MRISAVEIALISCLLLAGAGLRGAYPERMAVEHFDEGVYASNWFCRPPGLPDHTFPQQHLYAPPLLPALLEWVLIFTGSNAHAVMWVNVVFGTLTIPLVWWIARDWFGPIAGLLAASFAAFSDLHILFSRTALTDVPLVFFLTAGVWTGVRAILNGRPLWIALAAAFAALAWWTKYNGWLTLAITGAGLAGWLLFARPQGVRWRTLALRWMVIAALTCVFWSPVWWDLQDVGGYSAVAENHARYFVGLDGWWSSFTRHVAMWGYLLSGVGWAGAAGAVLASLVLIQWRGFVDSASPLTWPLRGVAIALVAAGLMATAGGVPAGLMLLACVALGRLLIAGRTSRRPEQEGASDLAVWVLVAWILGLLLSTPMYTPYPRLGLPLAAGLWMAAAPFTGTERRWTDSPRPTYFWLIAVPAVGIAIGVALLAHGHQLWPPFPEPAWADRTEIEQAAWIFATTVEQEEKYSAGGGGASSKDGVDAIIYVFGEPAMFYHLSAIRPSFAVDYLVQPVGDLGVLDADAADPGVPVWLVVGTHSMTAEDRQRLFVAEKAGRLGSAGASTDDVRRVYYPSSVVFLDEGHGWTSNDLPPGELKLFRVSF